MKGGMLADWLAAGEDKAKIGKRRRIGIEETR